MTPDIETLEEITNKSASRRAFLTRGAAGAGIAVVGATLLTALEADPAFATVGHVNFITPVRVFDSRTGNPQVGSGTQGIFTKGDTFREILFGSTTVDSDIIPDSSGADSIGAIITLTVTQTTASGALAATDAATGSTTTSAINWIGAGVSIANSMIVPVSNVAPKSGPNLTIKGMNVHFVGGGTGAKCHFIIDCSGYVAGA